MKISCEIIKDLLPLYKDEVCSEDSNTLIENHILECKNCREYFEKINETFPINNIEKNLNEAKPFKKISKHWRKSLIKSLIKGFLIATIIALVLFMFMDFKIVSN